MSLPKRLARGLRSRYPTMALMTILALVSADQLPLSANPGHTNASPRPAVKPDRGNPLFPATAPSPLARSQVARDASDVLYAPSASSGIPATVLLAYQRAADAVGRTDPACHLTWPILAGIGKVESNHAANGDVNLHGDVLRPIFGPALNGTHGVAAIPSGNHDVSGGQWARAEGPMQFLPSTWDIWGVDATGDGNRNVDNVFDASLAAAHYLCAGNADLATGAGLRGAILRYNDAPWYADAVLSWIRAYESGGSAVPDEPDAFAQPAVVDDTDYRSESSTSDTQAPSGTAGPPAHNAPPPSSQQPPDSGQRPGSPPPPPRSTPPPPPDGANGKQLLRPVVQIVNGVTTPVLGLTEGQ
jgi:membrane-bound lytic murein transglycosylase B